MNYLNKKELLSIRNGDVIWRKPFFIKTKLRYFDMNYLNKNELFFIRNGDLIWRRRDKYDPVRVRCYKDTKNQNIIYKIGFDKINYDQVIEILVKINFFWFEFKISYKFFFIYKLFGVLEIRIDKYCNRFSMYICRIINHVINGIKMIS